MTPEGRQLLNNLLDPYEAEVATSIENGQDLRFVTVRSQRPAEDILNVLDGHELVVHAENPVPAPNAYRIGRPLLRVLSVVHDAAEGERLYMEDINARRRENRITPSDQGTAAHDRARVLPELPQRRRGASVYPPGHPSVTGRKIV